MIWFFNIKNLKVENITLIKYLVGLEHIVDIKGSALPLPVVSTHLWIKNTSEKSLVLNCRQR